VRLRWGGLQFKDSLGKTSARPYLNNSLSMVARTCYPKLPHGRLRSGRAPFHLNISEKFTRLHLKRKNLSMVAYTCHHRCNKKDKIAENAILGHLAGLALSKLVRAKWAGGMSQVVVYLLCKHEVLS
jgi:hypothetical protein